jgi:hypothetical protein
MRLAGLPIRPTLREGHASGAQKQCHRNNVIVQLARQYPFRSQDLAESDGQTRGTSATVVALL